MINEMRIPFKSTIPLEKMDQHLLEEELSELISWSNDPQEYRMSSCAFVSSFEDCYEYEAILERNSQKE